MAMRFVFTALPLSSAIAWLKKQRQDYGHNSDVWDFLWAGTSIKESIMNRLREGTFAFQPLRQYRFVGETKEVWSAIDAVVIKVLALFLTTIIAPLMKASCFHLKGSGGSKKALREVKNNLLRYPFVIKSDVKSYYASIDHGIMMEKLHGVVRNKEVLRLIYQFLKRTVTFGGNYWTIERGISLGSPLSPLLGALYLRDLDERIKGTGCFYVRFMDDWVIMAKTRWQMKRALKIMYDTLKELHLEIAPDKTYIGRTDKGFDFLGYRFCPNALKLELATRTLEQAKARLGRLFERGSSAMELLAYVRRFLAWAKGGLLGLFDESLVREYFTELIEQKRPGARR